MSSTSPTHHHSIAQFISPPEELNFPMKICLYIYDNWNVPSVDKNIEVYWGSWYTGEDDITIHCSELITFPVIATRRMIFYRTYVNINIFVTDNQGTQGIRRDDIRFYLENLFMSNPRGLSELTFYDMVRIDTIMPSQEYDADYKNDIFRLRLRLELLGRKNYS